MDACRVCVWCLVCVLMGCSGRQWTPIAELEGGSLPVCQAPGAMLAPSGGAEAKEARSGGQWGGVEAPEVRGEGGAGVSKGEGEAVERGEAGVVFDFSGEAEAAGSTAPVAPVAPVSVPSRGCVDLNEASEAELVGLPGVGPGRARQIVARRDRRAFRTTRELKRIKGIGAKTYAKMAPMLCEVK